MSFPINSGANTSVALHSNEPLHGHEKKVVQIDRKKSSSKENTFDSYLKEEKNEKKTSSEGDNEVALNNFFLLLNSYFNRQEQNQENSINIKNNNPENVINSAEKNGKIIDFINTMSLLETTEKMNPNLDAFLVNKTNLDKEILQKMKDFLLENKVPINFQKEDLSSALDLLKQPTLQETELMPVLSTKIPHRGLFEESVPKIPLLFQSDLLSNQPELTYFQDLWHSAPVILPENNKKTEIILAELKNLPDSEQTKILQSLVLAKIENENSPKMNFSSAETPNYLSKNTQIVLADLQNKPSLEQLKILQSLLLSKIENENNTNFASVGKESFSNNLQNNEKLIHLLNNEAPSKKFDLIKNIDAAKELTPLFIANDQGLSQEFMDTTKEGEKDEDHIESSVIFGKNGEIFSHSDVTHSNENRSGILPTQANANAAINKAMDLADQLKATQGGTARFQIQDSHLGKINLQINMKNASSITVFVQTENEEVKKHIEDKIDFLKQSLDSQKIVLTDFKVTMVDKPSNTQSQFSNSSQQDQNPQNFNQHAHFHNNFNQNSNGENNAHITLDEEAIKNSSNKNYQHMQKNSITNIQRGANGSIKVLA